MPSDPIIYQVFSCQLILFCILCKYTIMINFSTITGFSWDVGNARKSQDKHGVTQSAAEEVFFNQPLLIAR